MTAPSTSSDPLVVKPREACRLLACGRTRLYQLIAAREIDSFNDGGSRKILTEIAPQVRRAAARSSGRAMTAADIDVVFGVSRREDLGRRVRIARPPQGMGFNDVLVRPAPSVGETAR